MYTNIPESEASNGNETIKTKYKDGPAHFMSLNGIEIVLWMLFKQSCSVILSSHIFHHELASLYSLAVRAAIGLRCSSSTGTTGDGFEEVSL